MLNKSICGKSVLLGTFWPKITQFHLVAYEIDIFWKKFKVSELRLPKRLIPYPMIQNNPISYPMIQINVKQANMW
jgi:hypothetical protein